MLMDRVKSMFLLLGMGNSSCDLARVTPCRRAVVSVDSAPRLRPVLRAAVVEEEEEKLRAD